MRTPPVVFSFLWFTHGCAKTEVDQHTDQQPSTINEIGQHYDSLRQPKNDLLVGGQPSKEMMTELANAQLKSVIDLKGPNESRGFPEAEESIRLGLTYHSLPIRSKYDITWEHAMQLQRLLKEVERPTLVHCESGNRVGALFALSAMVQKGLNVSQSIEIGREHGLTTLEGHVRSILEIGPMESSMPPSSLKNESAGDVSDF